MDSQPKTAIITGASGFVGSHLLKLLQARGFRVYGLVHNRDVEMDERLKIHGGIRALSSRRIDSIAPGLIVHCARPTMPRLKKIGRHLAAFRASMLNAYLLDQLKKSQSKPLLLFASGSLMYGSAEEAHQEDAPLNPISYARQYVRGEVPLLEEIRKESYPIGLFRLPWLLGPGSWFDWFYHRPIRQKGVFPYFGTQNNFMEIIDIRDAAALMLLHAEKGSRGIINIPSAAPVRQKEYNEMVAHSFNASARPYGEVFAGKIEKEALEAFHSNIILGSRHSNIQKSFEYTPLSETLSDIQRGEWAMVR